MLTKRMQQ